MTLRRALFGVLSVFIASCATPATASPSPTSSLAPATSAPATTAPATTAPASPSASAARQGVFATAAGPIPADATYVLVQNTGAERVLLIDLAARRSREVVRFDRPEAATRSVVLTASADGQTLALLERSDATVTLHIVHPATGDLRSLPQPAGIDSPNLSPDGSRVAVSRASSDAAVNGTWLLPADGSPGTRIIVEDPQAVGSPPKPRAWSADGRWLAAYGPVGAGGNQILVVDTRAGATTYVPPNGLTGGDGRVLTGIDAVWRSATEVIVWNSRSAFGGTPVVTSYDTATRASSAVFSAAAEQNIQDVVARPGSRQAAVLVAPFNNVTVTTPRTILLVEPGAAPRTLRDLAFVQRIWWSTDGAHLYVRTGGDDATGTITDVFGGAGLMQFCLRGGDAPPCP